MRLNLLVTPRPLSIRTETEVKLERRGSVLYSLISTRKTQGPEGSRGGTGSILVDTSVGSFCSWNSLIQSG